MDKTSHRMRTSRSVPLLSRGLSSTALPTTGETCKMQRDNDIEHQVHSPMDSSSSSPAVYSSHEPLVKKGDNSEKPRRASGSEADCCLPSLPAVRKRGKGRSKTSFGLHSFVKKASSVLFALWLLLTCATIFYFHWCGRDDGMNSHDKLNLINTFGGTQGRASEETELTPDRKIQFRPSVPPLFSQPSKQIPLPLPANKVSVVIMNHSRPRMIRESSLMHTLLAHPNVDEVLLLHSNPNSAFEYVHPKVSNIDASQHNDQMGLSLRFYFCQLAKNDWVIHVDDDMEFTSTTLSEMLIEFARNTHRIVGRFGRDLVDGNMFNGYSSKSTHKNTEVILTKLMVMEQSVCPSFFELSHLIWDDVVLQKGEGPLWNGEDIFMSLVANHVYGGTNNYAMDWLDVWNAPDYLKDYDAGKLDISGGMTGYSIWDWKWWQSVFRRNRHYSYRGTLWSTAKRRLSELEISR